MVKPGIYIHRGKGTIYQVLTVGAGPKPEMESYVVYQRLYEDCTARVIPLKDWDKKFKPFDLGTLDYCFDKIALVVIKDKKVLMARSKGKEHFYMPGGKRDTGESDVQCLVRECREELGIEVDPNSAFLYGVYTAYSYKDKPPATLTMYQANFAGTATPTSEIEEIGWLSYKDRKKAIGAGRLLLDELYWKGLVD